MQQLYMMVGQLLERSAHQGQDLTEIKSTLKRFDGRLTRIEQRRNMRMPPTEKHLKDLLAILLPAYTLYMTGSLQKALEMIQAVGGH